jgi:hypothetical protein
MKEYLYSFLAGLSIFHLCMRLDCLAGWPAFFVFVPYIVLFLGPLLLYFVYCPWKKIRLTTPQKFWAGFWYWAGFLLGLHNFLNELGEL